MDGSSKFVRGDAVAGILITFINIFGGIAIGVFQKGLDVMHALEKYTLLSIGDGLVSQVPALIVSVAAGILITRTGEEKDLASSAIEQVTLYPKAIAVVGAMLLMLAFVPGMPSLPFICLGALFLWIARLLMAQPQKASNTEDVASTALVPGNAPSQPALGMGTTLKDFEKVITIDTFAIEVGYGLVSLADPKQGGDLMDRITGVRKQFAKEMGMIVPPIALRDNQELDAHQYRFLLRGKSVAEGTILPKKLMAIQSGLEGAPLKGLPTKEPVFQLPAYWIDPSDRREAEQLGYTIVEGPSVVVTHLTEVLRSEAHRILEREDVQKLLDMVKEKNPTLIGELVPDLVNVGIVQRVLQNLLRERVSIKHLTVVLETIADVAPFSKNPDDLSEAARKRLGIYFVPQYEHPAGKLQALTLDPVLEQNLLSRIKKTQFEVSLLMDAALAQHLLQHLNLAVTEMVQAGLTPMILVTADIRLAFKRFFEPSFKQLVVLSYQELPGNVQIEPFGMITPPQVALTTGV
jgi:flagellar biosynthesis protein FlhA